VLTLFLSHLFLGVLRNIKEFFVCKSSSGVRAEERKK
jgi:hypothetical protein